MTVFTLKAKNDHLQKVASTRDYIKAISEFVWNALDADATAVSVEFLRNALDGLEGIIIRDDGTGISRARAEHDFESLGESWKLSKTHTPLHKRAIHGKEGQGRLRFFSLARRAHWSSVYGEDEKPSKITIDIEADRLSTVNVSDPTPVDKTVPTGTIVELAPLKDTFDWLASDEARAEFDATFAPYILQYPGTEIVYDRLRVNPKRTIERSYEFPTQPIITPGRVIRDLTLRIIEWKPRISGRKIYFGGESGVVLGSLAANVTAPGFEFSAYAYSPFFNELAKANLLEFDGLTDPDFARVLEYIRDRLTDYFRFRQAEKSGELIQDLKDAGVYPYEGDPKDEVERKERQVFDTATHAVASYSKDFKKADNPLKKITLGLLREAVSHNPESVSRILRAVFNLPKVRQDEFSQLLDKTELGNIISASSLVANRIVALKVLSEIVFDPKHRRSIKERGELDVLLRDNTWIFGEAFHFTMAEAGLSKIMHRVSTELALKRAKGAKGRKLDGKVGRIDSFMGRLVPQGNPDDREFLLVELEFPEANAEPKPGASNSRSTRKRKTGGQRAASPSRLYLPSASVSGGPGCSAIRANTGAARSSNGETLPPRGLGAETYPAARLTALGDNVGRAELACELLPRLVTAHCDDPLGTHLLGRPRRHRRPRPSCQALRWPRRPRTSRCP
jgi:hypothetical protein